MLFKILAALCAAVILLCVLFMLFFFSISKAESKELNIVTTNFPQYDFVKHIVLDKGKVQMLIKPGTDAHSFEPTPKDFISIEKSDLLVFNGGESDEWIENLTDSLKNKPDFFVFTNEVPLLLEEQKEGMEIHSSEETKKQLETDEHVWTSPKNDIIILRKLCEKIMSLDPDNAEFYKNNAKTYINRFKEIDRSFQEVTKNKNSKVLIFGDRFPFLYFVKEFDLDYYAAFKGCSNETEVSASTVKFLIDKAKEHKSPVILKIELTSDSIAKTIAEETGANVLEFYSGHNLTPEQFKNGESVASLFENNIYVLQKALW